MNKYTFLFFLKNGSVDRFQSGGNAMRCKYMLSGYPLVDRIHLDRSAFFSPSILAFLVLFYVLTSFSSVKADDEFVNFTTLDPFSGPSYSIGSLTVTGSNDVFITSSGLGILLGGPPFAPFLGNSTIDPGETVTFEFAGPASNIRVFSLSNCTIQDRDQQNGQRLDAILTAYDDSGTELNKVAISSTTCLIDFSGELASVPMSRLGVTVVADAFALPSLAFEVGAAAVPEFSCDGFKPPFHRSQTLRNKDKRAIPVKLVLTDEDGELVTGGDVTAMPVINITHNSNPTADASSKGKANTGNTLRYDSEEQQWIYNLDTGKYSDSGTYRVSVASGDGSEYTIDTTNTCEQVFERLP